MEDFRLKQAETLLRAAANNRSKNEVLKNPKEGSIDVNTYENIINNLLEAEEFIYSSRPHHKLNQEDATKFIEKIISARMEIDKILGDFGVLDKDNPKEEVKEHFKDYLFLTTKNNFKKTISKFGVDPQKIVVAGVPLIPEDMMILNPKLPDAALEPIKIKIQHVKNDIERKMDQFNLEKVIVLVEKDKSGELLGKRANEFYNAKFIAIDNLKDINIDEFVSAIS
jgi:hypothetical protein